MSQKKKLQVFISSTYDDLKEERQAAVEAILTAGHIPAGMELFAAGDQSQMSVIKRWIDESDVYLLILGGRYGSIEPKTQKSYIHLEYEYAVERSRPLFAVVIDSDQLEKRVKKSGSKVLETENSQKLKEFRALVLTRMVRFWKDPRDIKLAILETVSEFSRRDDVVGWVPANEVVNASAVAEEIARLAKENATLREQVKVLSAAGPALFNGLTFEQMYKLLAITKLDLDVDKMGEKNVQDLQTVAEIFGDPVPGLLHAFWVLSEQVRRGGHIKSSDRLNMKIASKLEEFGLLKSSESTVGRSFELTDIGSQFLVRLRLERDAERAERFILSGPVE